MRGDELLRLLGLQALVLMINAGFLPCLDLLPPKTSQQ